jgi:hypothetical protein
VKFVNVLTGEVTTLSRSKIKGVPMTDDDGKPSLYPVYEASPGKYKIDSFFSGELQKAIREKKLEASALKIDPKSLEVPS